MNDQGLKEFDVFAEGYRQIHTQNIQKISGTDSAYFAEFKVRILSAYEANQKCKLLDLGCGDGLTEYYIELLFPAFENEGIDVSSKSIDLARKRNLSRSIFSSYDGSVIPFPDNHFDIIFVAGVFHHVPETMHLHLMYEIFRVLKKNGRLYLFEHNPWNPLTKYLVKTCVFDRNAKLVNPIHMRRLLQQSGFEDYLTRFIIFFPRSKVFRIFHFLESSLSFIPFGGQYYVRATKS